MNSRSLNVFPRFRDHRGVLVGGMLAVALISCSSPNGNPGDPAGDEGSSIPSQPVEMPVEQVNRQQPLKIVLDTEHRESALMNRDGGTLTITSTGSDVSMTLPRSALLEESEISLTAVSAIENLPISSGLLSAVQMGPEGMRFMQPVTVSLELPDPIPDGLMGFMLKDDGQGFHFYPGEIIGNTFTFQVMHFSTVGVGAVTDADRDAARSDEPAGMELAEELIANLDELFKDGISQDDALFEVYFEEVAEVLYEAYMGEGGIWDQLVTATSVEELQSAIQDYYQWRLMVEEGNLGRLDLPMPLNCGFEYTCTKLGDFDGTSLDLIDFMLQQLATAANKRCLEGDGSAEGELFRLLKFTDMLWSETNTRDDLYERISGLKTCGLSNLTIDAPPSLCLSEGDTIQLNAIATDGKGNVVAGREMIWISGNSEVASVSSTGLVTVNGSGTTLIELFDGVAEYLQGFTPQWTINVFSLSGKWSVTEVANEVACGSGTNTYLGTATITQLGDLISMTGGDHGTFSGVKSGCSILGAGDENEDDGFSFGDGGLTISPDGNTITGFGSWTWTGPGESGVPETCSGTSSITYHR